MLASLGAALTVFAAGLTAWLVVRWAGDVLNPLDTTAPQRVPFTGGYPPVVHAWSPRDRTHYRVVRGELISRVHGRAGAHPVTHLAITKTPLRAG